MAKYAKYGDKKMDLGDLSLDKAKEIMARFFPELAEPKIETKKEGEDTIYVFSKQAGRKGSDAQFTPGPWRVSPKIISVLVGDESDPEIVALLGGSEDVMMVANRADTGEAEALANARLIAAAPDLFNACVLLEQFAKRVLDYTERNPKNLLYGDELVQQSRAILSALSKARGESQ